MLPMFPLLVKVIDTRTGGWPKWKWKEMIQKAKEKEIYKGGLGRKKMEPESNEEWMNK
jgi:hypothetical protein